MIGGYRNHMLGPGDIVKCMCAFFLFFFQAGIAILDKVDPAAGGFVLTVK